LNEHDKVFENVDMTKNGNNGKTSKDATKDVGERDNDTMLKMMKIMTCYDNEVFDLTKEQLAFRDAFDINLQGFGLIDPFLGIVHPLVVVFRMVRADVKLKYNIVVVISKLVGDESIRVLFVLSMSENLSDVRIVRWDLNRSNKSLDMFLKRRMSTLVIIKKKYTEPTIDVSNLNPFYVLNSVENDVDLGTNGGISNMASKKANSSGSSFWNVESSSTSTISIVDKIDKIKRLIVDGNVTLVDDEGKPLANCLLFSLLEQWKETYDNDDYDFDPYDDDMYEGQDIHDKIQSICDNLNIKVRGRKKKYYLLPLL
nr:hypothetical protein [Tanacetum cinerariifolium]